MTRPRLLGIFALILIPLSVSAPARAEPVLFVGNLGITNVYANTLICGSGIGLPCTTQPVQTLSVTQSGALTLPARLFSYDRTSIATGTYPFVAFRSRVQSGQGSFYSGYATPSILISYAATTTAPPGDPTRPRLGVIRILPGPNGFGGKMRFKDYGFFDGFALSAVGVFSVLQRGWRYRGAGGIGGMGSMISGTGSHTTLMTTGGSPAMISFQGATTRAGWFTGTLTVTDSISARTAFSSVTAMDDRNSAGTHGTISLISPLLLWTYRSSYGTAQKLDSGWASYSRLNLRLLPEPARLRLLAIGLLGLWATHMHGRLRPRPDAPGTPVSTPRRGRTWCPSPPRIGAGRP